jgi:TPP-dependent indolepyruvate ferredoxin oxidoreductase alpha subunit
MPKNTVSLDDKYALDETRQVLTGTQAIVRLMLTQRARDVKAGLNTAGYVTGYRGSPIASLESAMLRARGLLEPNHIKFMAGLNEDLAATALWGAQQAELRGEGKYDGVFGVWYGKGPGVDRTGDVFRHANHAGTSKNGGVLALMGDDHTCESSTSAHQSEFAFLDYMMPILNPAGVQEILDYGILGFALSRYAGVWVGIKCVKDNIEATPPSTAASTASRSRFPRTSRRRPAGSTSGSAIRRSPRNPACTTSSAPPFSLSPAPTSSTRSSPAAARTRSSASSPPARATSMSARPWTSSASTRCAPTSSASASTRSP